MALGPNLEADLHSLGEFLRAKRGKRSAEEILARDRGVEAFSGLREHAPITPKLEREIEEWRGLGGDPSELLAERDRLSSGKISYQQYAAWKRHAKHRLVEAATGGRSPRS